MIPSPPLHHPVRTRIVPSGVDAVVIVLSGKNGEGERLVIEY
jgi:hypothetical protein